METARYKSRFAGRLEGFVAYKRDMLNFKATSEEKLWCPRFDRFCAENFPDKGSMDMELAMAWIGDCKGGARHAADMASFQREFARYLIYEGEDAYVLPFKVTPADRHKRIPHIFNPEEAGAFFAVADSLKPDRRAGLRHLTTPVFYRLLYCSGLRTFEARELPVERFDLEDGIIHVIDAKGKDRDVPLSDDVTEMCRRYSDEVEVALPRREFFFPNADGSGPWSYNSMLLSFNRCCRDAGIFGCCAGSKPIPYDFRHTFATECIRRWKAEGVDVDANLRFLQAYMGHSNLEDTLYYVHLVRGGFGDPTAFDTWEPQNLIREVGHA